MKNLIVLIIAVAAYFSTFAQKDQTKEPVNKTDSAQQVMYTCSMHPEIVSNKPGACSKCGMALTQVKTYACSMHPEITSNKKGKCSKCGMDLTEVKPSPQTKKS